MKKFRALHGPRSTAATRSGVCKPCKLRAAFEGCEQRLSPDQLQEVRFLGSDLGSLRANFGKPQSPCHVSCGCPKAAKSRFRDGPSNEAYKTEPAASSGPGPRVRCIERV